MHMKVLMILPCYKKKTGKEIYFGPELKFEDLLQLDVARKLSESREHFRSYIDFNSTPMSALGRYNGFLYRCTPDFKQQLKNSIQNGEMEVLIMSAVYGFIHPFQRIFKYERVMDNQTANMWISLGLPEILEECIRSIDPHWYR